MKKILSCLVVLFLLHAASAQKIDSIYFHLYTDSLKKGQHNYINVDGKLSTGNWRPLTSREITFTSSACSFSGNELIVPMNFSEEKIKIKAVLKNDPAIWKEIIIWVKKLPDPDRLPTREEILRKDKL